MQGDSLHVVDALTKDDDECRISIDQWLTSTRSAATTHKGWNSSAFSAGKLTVTEQTKPHTSAAGAAASTGDQYITQQVARVDQAVRAYVARHNTIEARIERIAQALAGLSQRDRVRVLAAVRMRANAGGTMTARVRYQQASDMPPATRHVLEHDGATYDVYIVDYDLTRHVIVTLDGGEPDAWEFWSADFAPGLTDAALATSAVERVVCR